MTVVPSHSFKSTAVLPVNLMVTVPEANQVPEVPCAQLGPSVYEPFAIAVFEPSELVAVERLVESVPVPVMGPPVRPVPLATLVTLPMSAARGVRNISAVPLRFSFEVPAVPLILETT